MAPHNPLGKVCDIRFLLLTTMRCQWMHVFYNMHHIVHVWPHSIWCNIPHISLSTSRARLPHERDERVERQVGITCRTTPLTKRSLTLNRAHAHTLKQFTTKHLDESTLNRSPPPSPHVDVHILDQKAKVRQTRTHADFMRNETSDMILIPNRAVSMGDLNTTECAGREVAVGGLAMCVPAVCVARLLCVIHTVCGNFDGTQNNTLITYNMLNTWEYTTSSSQNFKNSAFWQIIRSNNYYLKLYNIVVIL